MEMALSEITLVVFTAIAPAGAAGYVAMALYARALRDVEQANRIDRCLVIPLSLALAGLIASATHLGTPANALYVITGIGHSPLSNEVASAAAFLAIGGAYWMLSFPHRGRGAAKTALLALAAVSAAAFLLFVSRAYAVESIITWNNPVAPLAQWAGGIAAGALVALAGLHASRVPVTKRSASVLIGASLFASAVNVALLAVEWGMVSGLRTVTESAARLAPHFVVAIVAFAVLAVAGAALAWTGERAPRVPEAAREGASVLERRRLVFSVAACVLLLAACFVVRFAFYALYMTAGV